MMSFMRLLIIHFRRLLIIRMNARWWLPRCWRNLCNCSICMMILSLWWLRLLWTKLVDTWLVKHFVCNILAESSIYSETSWNCLFVHITFNGCTFWRLTDSLFRVFEGHHIHCDWLHVCEIEVIWSHSNFWWSRSMSLLVTIASDIIVSASHQILSSTWISASNSIIIFLWSSSSKETFEKWFFRYAVCNWVNNTHTSTSRTWFSRGSSHSYIWWW